MEIVCKKCGAKLVVPDDRITKGSQVQGECPRCKTRITLDTERPEEPTPEDFFYQEGIMLALILESAKESLQAIEKKVGQMGFMPICPLSAKEAIFRLCSHQFDLVVLSDGFEGASLSRSSVVEYLNSLPMRSRRRMVVAYIADAFKTGDAMEAYCLSADLVVKRSDLEKLEGILTHCLAEKKRNYAAFFDAMAEGGREL
ncbi:MAG: hypothetical protein COW41_07575 [Deltaproteobacteria bacterium CG17_big_fil_post_rev_8_21_14_2_50_51_6]|nr:MAG: hypothetical protein COW41_07575 [Deltaproteobacteria bacterium CG17_big_fil_post_rev_8_21_14_2_50_51_6]